MEALWIADGIPEVLCVAQTTSEMLLMALVVSQMLQIAGGRLGVAIDSGRLSRKCYR